MSCAGGCCAVFWLNTDLVKRLRADPQDDADGSKGITDGEQIADMIVPLNRRQALRRWRRFVSSDLPLPRIKNYTDEMFTCRHWDEKTRLCTIYEERPDMCRNYPYGMACSHGCDYRITDPAIVERYKSTVEGTAK